MKSIRYVLITPARNEADYIKKTIQSVIRQTVLPVKWVIVDDGSTDNTADIVQMYAHKHNFIHLISRKTGNTRNFGSKVNSINAGYEKLAGIDYDFIGNLDADVSFEADYYESILKKFHENFQLGLAGGIRFDYHKGAFKRVPCAKNSVGGPFQLFRRECYEEIGGYRPLTTGGIDALAEIMARMHGWQVESFPEFVVKHYRCTSTAKGSGAQLYLREGHKEYMIGYHPLFEIVRCTQKAIQKKSLRKGLLWFSGYALAGLRRTKRPIPEEVVRYLRSEQMGRLRQMLVPNSAH